VTRLPPRDPPDDPGDVLRGSLVISEHALLDALAVVRENTDTTPELPPISFTIRQAADALQMGAEVVLNAVRTGALPAEKIAGRWGITLEDLVAFENKRHDAFIGRALSIAGGGRRTHRRTPRR
jgi:hypothetical protein